ncbi:FmdB family zinc ribbon protein [Achromobacter sp. ESBL13]|uniref:FmdB family zinc ribbon protein n=1 Tax=Achromobacter sp. ESBL13 TaxID=3077328 RepID=UPI002FCB1B68
MPIYAYKCSACGHAKDVLQKISDAPLSVCPECGQSTFSKQVTAAGFQLKGSGWYVTDFRNNGSGGGAATSATAPSEGSATATPAAPAASTAPAPAAAPAASPAAPAGGTPA